MKEQILKITDDIRNEEITVEYARYLLLCLFGVSGSLLSDIRDEMDADMEDSGMAQGEIESCLNHWGNKYVIQRKEWFSNDR